MRKTQRGLAHSELVQRIFRRQEYLSCDDVVLAVDIILDAIAAHLARGGPIQIHRLGTFTTRLRRPRIGRNPKTGQPMDVPIHRVPHFRPSPSLLDALEQTHDGR